jgi:hypothetical protein
VSSFVALPCAVVPGKGKKVELGNRLERETSPEHAERDNEPGSDEAILSDEERQPESLNYKDGGL